MKKLTLLMALRTCLAIALVSFMFYALPGQAQPSQYMTYQGYLTDGNGNPLGTTNSGPKAYDVVFRIWDVPTGGTTNIDEIHAELQTVTVDNGYFSVLLGQGSQYLSEPFARPLSSAFTNALAPRYLEITVQGIGVSGANITILPRLQLVSSPYAFLAANAQNVTGSGVIAAANIAQNTITSNNIAANTITGDNIAANTIAGGNIAPGTITGNNIAGNTITGGNIAGQTITSANILNNSIQASSLASAIGVWTAANGNVYRNSGSVGIGTTTPSALLDVEGFTFDNSTSGPYFNSNFKSGSTLGSFGNNTANYVSIQSQWYVLAFGFIAQSDRRIKDIVSQSDPAIDLATIQRLKVTDYKMKDRVAAGEEVHKGFIAQEVKAVMPEAVNKSRAYIPNIYAVADKLSFDTETQTLRVTLTKPHELQKGDKVRLIQDDSTLEREVVATPDDSTFVVASIAKAPKRIFVFGKQVDDFLSVDYNRIFSAGIGAIQELATRVEKLEAREAQVAELEQKMAHISTLEREVAELKQAVAQLAEAGKAARQARVEEEHHLITAGLSQ